MNPEDVVDLSNCDREPIHLPRAVQPHGVLFACHGADLRVAQVSDNVEAACGVSIDAVLEQPLARVLTADSWARLRPVIAAGAPSELNPTTVETPDGNRWEAICHQSPTSGITVVELEPWRGGVEGFLPQLRASLRRLQSPHALDALCTQAADEVRALTGFDRVMVYRFDEQWNGTVVAEAKRGDLEPFLGLHYPAADIPAQARRLYTLNWLRFIPDVHYVPAVLVPTPNPVSGGPLDLSHAVLRSVSPIHIEYLRNMGVRASMSVSLVRDGRLIGLIACHHYAGPHEVSFAHRESVEFLGQVLSWQVATLEGRQVAERALAVQRTESTLMAAISTARSIPEGLCTPDLLALTGAEGAALFYEGKMYLVGTTPAEAQVRQIAAALRPAHGDESPAVTDQVAVHLPEAAPWEDVAAGAMVVYISRELDEYVCWFRPATDRTVDWAGDPRKVEVTATDGTPRLCPRGSFALWREIVKGRSLPWEPWQIEAASNLRRMLLGSVRLRADQLRVMNEQLAAADRVKDEFLATVGHELRTPLNAMVGWLHLLKGGELDDARKARAIETIDRNARAQSQLIDDLLDVSRIVTGKLTIAVKPVELGSIVERALEAQRPAAEAKRIRLQSALDSTSVILGDADRLQQVIGNLLSNAIKFTPKEGRVQVFVERRDSSVDVTVTDTGQGIAPELLPHVFERFRQGDAGAGRGSAGLGLGLSIVRHIVELHGGSVSASSEGINRGATFVARLPLAAVRREVTPPPAGPRQGRQLDCPDELRGMRILVLEDDTDAREMLRVLLNECGAVVQATASAREALTLVPRFRPDVIVSDIGMPEVDGYSFIESLRALSPDAGGKTPAVALTAHARVEDRARALYAGFNNHVPKPIEPIELFAVIASLGYRPA